MVRRLVKIGTDTARGNFSVRLAVALSADGRIILPLPQKHAKDATTSGHCLFLSATVLKSFMVSGLFPPATYHRRAVAVESADCHGRLHFLNISEEHPAGGLATDAVFAVAAFRLVPEF